MDIIKARQFKAKSLFQMADLDYISCRHLAMLETKPVGLILFAGAQCLEKYMKACLLYAGFEVNKLSHSLPDAWHQIKQNFSEHLSNIEQWHQDICISLMERLNNSDHGRYFAADIHISGNELNQLDVAVIYVLRNLVKKITEQKNMNFPTGAVDMLSTPQSSPWKHSHTALNLNNLALNPKINNINSLSHIQHVHHDVPVLLITHFETVHNQNKIEKVLGYKLSRQEYERTFVITSEELARLNSSNTTSAQKMKLLTKKRNKELSKNSK